MACRGFNTVLAWAFPGVQSTLRRYSSCKHASTRAALVSTKATLCSTRATLEPH